MVTLLRAVAILAFIAATQANAQTSRTTGPLVWFTGQEMWEMCATTTVGTPPDSCIAYVLGAVDAEATVADVAQRPGFICPTRTTTGNDLVQVVRRHLLEHPEDRSAIAASVVIVALRAAFPCPAARN